MLIIQFFSWKTIFIIYVEPIVTHFHWINYFIFRIISIILNLSLNNNLSKFKCKNSFFTACSFNSQSRLRYLSRSWDIFSLVVSYAMYWLLRDYIWKSFDRLCVAGDSKWRTPSAPINAIAKSFQHPAPRHLPHSTLHLLPGGYGLGHLYSKTGRAKFRKHLYKSIQS